MDKVEVGILDFFGGFFLVFLGCQQLPSLFLPPQMGHFLFGVSLFRSTEQNQMPEPP